MIAIFIFASKSAIANRAQVANLPHKNLQAEACATWLELVARALACRS
jgi:hypothetical protein